MRPTVEELVKWFCLEPHLEGGYYREPYRANELVKQEHLPPRFGGDRDFSTSIYFLLPKGACSHFHRIASDEVWHFYLGDPLTIVEILPDGLVKKTTMGQDLRAGQQVQYVVSAGNWFGAYPNPKGEYSFVGATVAPGFDFADFELAKRETLLKEFPHAKDVICALT